ncbi:alpha/beta hydrolase [Tropicimonas sp. TH_r6]|uniref:alpha/beta hydrolase n=1 Tax=Tropicimonas sp. TH_r6 TaxID=3082085 RepID=UPI002955CB91|nr:alpha/beta fold hydrolase [Tropicimonas sp. TH_r6]MDV7144499.1 alpha/beta hydrolase [Tropicimonas sp. TH_r6]
MRMLAFGVLGLLLVIGALFLFGPREPVDRDISFAADTLGDNLDDWLAKQEADVPNLRPEAVKRIQWAGEPGATTPLSIIYLHGFSASAEEIRPVPDKVAETLGANLFFTRLTGHGRDGDAMAEATAGDWIEDMAEALAIGRRLGERVLVISTSTGGTLAALAATDPDLSDGLAGVVFVSPNFALQNPKAGMLTLPLARYWLPHLVGPERGFEPLNDAHAAHWTTRYPTTAVLPMMALVEHVDGLDLSAATVPALFVYSEQDQVVSPEKTAEAMAAWGGPTEVSLRVMGPEDDPSSHVISGDSLSPGQTEETARIIADWAGKL